MDFEEILADIKRKGYRRIGIQTPDGLKDKGVEIAIKLKNSGLEPIIVTASSFGACDLADEKVMKLGAECLIHLGHSKFYVNGQEIKEEIPIYYLEWRYSYPIKDILEKNAHKISERRIGIICTAQHLHQISEAAEILKKFGIEAVIGEEGVRTKRKAQILGCDSTSAQFITDKVDALLYIGSGYFHPIKILDAGKKLYKLDPIEGNFKVVDPELRRKEVRAEYLKVLKYAEEKNWGILLSTKKGQFFPHIAERVKNKLESFGKNAIYFIGDRIFERDLIGFKIKIFVNTACPRLPPDFQEVAVVNHWALKALDEYYNKKLAKQSQAGNL